MNSKQTSQKKSIQSKYKREHSAYKHSRKERGNFMLYVEENLVNTWYSKNTDTRKRGRPNKYSDLSSYVISWLIIKMNYATTQKRSHRHCEQKTLQKSFSFSKHKTFAVDTRLCFLGLYSRLLISSYAIIYRN